MCNVSKKLMEDINKILKEIGFKTSMWITNSNKTKWSDISRLSINGFRMLKKWEK